jgi:hypothetical protein
MVVDGFVEVEDGFLAAVAQRRRGVGALDVR